MTMSKDQVLDRIAAMMGANEEWDSAADYLEDIAALITKSGAYEHPVSDQRPDALAYWRGIADEVDIYYHKEE